MLNPLGQSTTTSVTTEFLWQVHTLHACEEYTGWPKKVSRSKIVLKPVNEIRFIFQIKALVKHYNIIRWY